MMKAHFHLHRVVAAALIIASVAVWPPTASASPWVDAYYPYWQQSVLAPDKIEMHGVSDLIYFALLPLPDGTIDATHLRESAAVVTVAHNAHAKAIISVGGEGSVSGFRGAVSPENVVAFVANIVDWVTANGFDGVDIDFEPLEESDAANYRAFCDDLRIAMNLSGRKMVLFAVPTPGTDPAILKPIMDDFDQINIQTYRLSGPYPGWVTWYDAPLYDGGNTFPIDRRPMPSADTLVACWRAAGFPAKRLGIGVSCWGMDWIGAAAPLQSISGVTAKPVSYAAIMSRLYSAEAYHYDSASRAAWLGLPDDFVSYEDPQACTDKILYLRQQKLGGVIIWDIAGGYLPDNPQTVPLLEAVVGAMHARTGN